jgi:hypothetical protein
MQRLLCRKNPNFKIASDGSFQAQHTPDPDFSATKFIAFVKERYRISWKEMYWKVAGFNVTAHCLNCRQVFVLPKTYFCRTHPEPGINQYGENKRYYKCCNSYEDRFSLAPGASGCESSRHEFSNIDAEV